jgi:hypothetical protein
VVMGSCGRLGVRLGCSVGVAPGASFDALAFSLMMRALVNPGRWLRRSACAV